VAGGGTEGAARSVARGTLATPHQSTPTQLLCAHRAAACGTGRLDPTQIERPPHSPQRRPSFELPVPIRPRASSLSPDRRGMSRPHALGCRQIGSGRSTPETSPAVPPASYVVPRPGDPASAGDPAFAVTGGVGPPPLHPLVPAEEGGPQLVPSSARPRSPAGRASRTASQRDLEILM
jgi:hypothetical protein